MRLLGSLTSPYVRKARIVLAEKKIEYAFVQDNPWDEHSRVPDANPLGKVPVLVLEDDSTLFDSRVIVEFLDKRAYCADCMRTAADLHFRLRQRRAPIGIEPHGVMECLPQLVRYGIRHARTFHCDGLHREVRSPLRSRYRRNAAAPAAARSAVCRRV